MTMPKAIVITSAYLKFNLMSAMEYRGAFMMQAFGMVLNDLALLFFWGVFFTQFPALNGWALHDVLTLYAIVAANFGLGNILFGNGFNLAQVIATGGLDYYLALPVSPLIHMLVSRMNLSAWGDLIFGVGLFAVLWGANPGAWLVFLIGTTLGAAVMVAFAVALGTFAFYLGNAEALAAQGIGALISFSTYPVDLFPLAVRVVLYTLIPAAFLSSIPTELVRGFEWLSLAEYAAGTLAIMLLARWIFYRGLRHYESGNLLVARI
ncbi:MAG: ABC-2 family transporter protein [Chloroflexi bacterium]|nr:ABC-2 family transporter protein [Chloroflexota bacterium]MBI3733455.1 ABC-2 family transporter protein [Chloroflexota bacterium]